MLYLLLQKQNDEKLYLENYNQTQSVVVSNSLPNFCLVQGLQHHENSLIYFEVQGNVVTYKLYNSSLNLNLTKSGVVKFKNAVKKVVPVYKKGTTFSNTADFVVVTHRNEVNLVNVVFLEHENAYKINHSPIFLSHGSDAYAQELNGLITVFITNTNSVKKLSLQHFIQGNYYKKISSKEFYNAKLGFVTNEQVPFYYYLKNFDQEQTYD